MASSSDPSLTLGGVYILVSIDSSMFNANSVNSRQYRLDHMILWPLLHFDIYIHSQADCGTRYTLKKSATTRAWKVDMIEGLQRVRDLTYLMGMVEAVRLPPEHIDTFKQSMKDSITYLNTEKPHEWILETIQQIYRKGDIYWNAWSNTNLNKSPWFVGDSIIAWARTLLDDTLGGKIPRPVVDLPALRSYK